MTDEASSAERAALLVLLKSSDVSWSKVARRVQEAGSALTVAQEDGLLDDTLFGDGTWDVDHASATEAIVRWGERGVRLLTVLDAGYPDRLEALAQLPPVIFMRGTLAASDAAGVAIIGSRRADTRSLATATRLAGELAEAGTTVISGLAVGIDTAAHRGALAAGGRTVAVIGTGVDRSYPKENAALQELLASEHLVVSRFWPEAGPSKVSFPMRNELMAGWGRATCVVQADERSGARIQARQALAQGRSLFFCRTMEAEPWARKYVSEEHAVFVDGAADLLP